MKDSGFGWLGKVPTNWKVERLQWHLYEINVKNNPIRTTNVLSLTNKKGVIPYEEKGAQGNISKENYNEYHLAYKDTIVANSMNILIGSVGYSDYYGCVSPVYYVFKEKEDNDLHFFNYIMQTTQFQRELRKYANGILEIRLRVSSDDILKRRIAVPEYGEQKKIATYLDEQCKKIDEIMADIQNQIDTLEDYKKSVISEAVTRGLDPNVEMQDSGIAFAKKIPAHWELHPVYYYFSEGKIKNTGCTENNLLSLSYGNIIRKDINTSEGLLPASFSTYNIVEKDDIIIRPTDLQNDKRSLRTGLVKEKGIITSAYIDLKPKTNVNSRYFHYLLHSYDVKKVFYNMGNGVRQGLNFDEFSKLSVFNPPIKEQEEIAEYLDSKCAEIDSIIEDKKTQLETIENYKKSLIYEYVTGKKEVPENE